MTATAQTQDAGVIAVSDAALAGGIFWWSLSGDLDFAKLHTAWMTAGYDEKLLPKGATPAEALNRAVHAFQNKRTLARPLGGKRGWALVSEATSNDGNDLQYDTLCTARVDSDGHLHISHNNPDLNKQILGRYHYYRNTLTATDVSMWLSGRLIAQAHAIKLRSTGGVYFIPHEQLDTFKAWAGLLRGISDHVVYEVPALKSDEAVEAILAALMAEADTEVGAMETELDTEDLGKRALKTRTRRCDDLRVKLVAYEGLLGRSMDAMQGRLEGLQAALVEASMLEGDDNG